MLLYVCLSSPLVLVLQRFIDLCFIVFGVLGVIFFSQLISNYLFMRAWWRLTLQNFLQDLNRAVRRPRQRSLLSYCCFECVRAGAKSSWNHIPIEKPILIRQNTSSQDPCLIIRVTGISECRCASEEHLRIRVLSVW